MLQDAMPKKRNLFLVGIKLKYEMKIDLICSSKIMAYKSFWCGVESVTCLGSELTLNEYLSLDLTLRCGL